MLIQEVEFKMKETDRNSKIIYFYKHNDKFFRDFLVLETDKELETAMKVKFGIYNSLKECEEEFHNQIKEKNCIIIN